MSNSDLLSKHYKHEAQQRQFPSLLNRSKLELPAVIPDVPISCPASRHIRRVWFSTANHDSTSRVAMQLWPTFNDYSSQFPMSDSPFYESNESNSNFSEILHSNNDSMDDIYPDFTQLTSVRIAFIVIYLVVIVLTIVGNAMVCITVYRNKKMHTAVNYYIVNLAICDLLVGAFVMPVKLLELTAPLKWNILDDALCTLLMFVQTVFVFSSVLTLVATCVERYFAIVHPLESRMHHSKSRAKRILFAVWIIPCFVASPHLYPSIAMENHLHSSYGTIVRRTCFDSFNADFRLAYFLFLFVFIYLLPLCFITGTCVCIFRALLMGISFHRQGSLRRQESNRRKVAKMVIVVVFAYAIFWSPYFLVTIVTQLQTENFLQERHYFFTMLCINFLAFTNSCVNPFIYGAMSARFRHGFRSIFLILCCSLCPSVQRRLSGDKDPSGETRITAEKCDLAYGADVIGRCSSTFNNVSYSDTPPCSSQDNTNGLSTNTQLTNDTALQIRPDSIGSKNHNNNECQNTYNSVIRKFKVDRLKRGQNGSVPETSGRSAWTTLTHYARNAKMRFLKLMDTSNYRYLRENTFKSTRHNKKRHRPTGQYPNENALKYRPCLDDLQGLSPSACVFGATKGTIKLKYARLYPSYPIMSHSSPNVSIGISPDRNLLMRNQVKSLHDLDRLSSSNNDIHIQPFFSDIILPARSMETTSAV